LAISSFQLHARQRRAQVVRDAGQDDRAVLLELLQVVDHLVEAAVGLDDLLRAFFGQRGGALALGDRARGRGQARQRQVDQARDEGRAQQRQRAHHVAQPSHCTPREAGEAVAFEHQPVFVAVDVEADPEARHVVDAAREAGVLAEPLAHHGGDLGHQRVGGRRIDLVGPVPA
jgi:hypothetical protein